MAQADGAQFRRRLRLRDQPAVPRVEPDQRRIDRGAAVRTEAAIGNDQRIVEKEQFVRIVAMRRPCRDATEAGAHVEDADMAGPVIVARFGRVKNPIAGAECRMAAEHEARRCLHRLPHEARSGVEYQQEPARPAGDGNGQRPVGRDREAMAAPGQLDIIVDPPARIETRDEEAAARLAPRGQERCG